MNYDQAYAAFCDTLSDEERQEIFHGGVQNYHRACKQTTEKNLVRRCQELLRSLCVWRLEAHYPLTVKFSMLNVLSRGLFAMRMAAVAARDMIFFGDGGDCSSHQHDIGGHVNP